MTISKEQRQEAIEFFVKIGFFIPVDSLTLYHARARVVDTEQPDAWVVDPERRFFKNSKARRDLSASESIEFAKVYAENKVKDYAGKGIEAKEEIYEIVSTVEGALIINIDFDKNLLSEEEKKMFKKYSEWLVSGRISEYAPVKFEDKDSASIVFEYIKRYKNKTGVDYISNDAVKRIYLEVSSKAPRVTKQLVEDIAGAVNARNLVLNDPTVAIDRFQQGINTTSHRGSVIPLNLDYIAHWAKSCGLVGTKTNINQITGPTDCYWFFDTYAVNTISAKAKMIADMNANYWGISILLGEFDTKSDYIMSILTEPNPENIIDTLQNDERFAHMFKAPAKVWERFSVGEHTETCLRIFDSGVANEMPKELHPFMRLAIICHDIGKGMPMEDSGSQMYNNIKYARQFMSELGVPIEIIEVVCTIISAQEYTSNYYVDGNKNADKNLFLYLTSKLEEIYGFKPLDEVVKGLMSMCKALQISDSGAYTRYGVTRDKDTGIYYKNANDNFTKSFAPPKDITNERLRFENDKTL